MICCWRHSAYHRWLGCSSFYLDFKENGLSSVLTVRDALSCYSYKGLSFSFCFHCSAALVPFCSWWYSITATTRSFFIQALLWSITQAYVHSQLRISWSVSTANLEASITSKLKGLKSFWYQHNWQHLKKRNWKNFAHPISGNISFPFPSLHAHTSFIFKSAGTVVQFSSLWQSVAVEGQFTSHWYFVGSKLNSSL